MAHRGRKSYPNSWNIRVEFRLLFVGYMLNANLHIKQKLMLAVD